MRMQSHVHHASAHFSLTIEGIELGLDNLENGLRRMEVTHE